MTTWAVHETSPAAGGLHDRAEVEVGQWQAALIALHDAEETFTAHSFHEHAADARRVRGAAMLGAALGEGAEPQTGLALLREVLASGLLRPIAVPSVHLTMARALHGADRCKEDRPSSAAQQKRSSSSTTPATPRPA